MEGQGKKGKGRSMRWEKHEEKELENYCQERGGTIKMMKSGSRNVGIIVEIILRNSKLHRHEQDWAGLW